MVNNMNVRIEPYVFDDALEFFKFICAFSFPYGERYDGKGNLFRGQASDKYELLPRAFRKNDKLLFEHSWRNISSLVSNAEQLQAELHTLLEFVETADRLGLTLPEDGQGLRRSLRKSMKTFTQSRTGMLQVKWPSAELWSLMALAQHHGIPTRLLDWTWDARIAAYFAAVGALEYLDKHPLSAEDDERRLAVWSIYHDVFDEDAGDNSLLTAGQLSIVRLSAPASGNARLGAQRGAFLMPYFPTLVMDARAERSSLVEFAQQLPERGGALRGEPEFSRFSLPVAQAADLLLLLRLAGIHGGTTFPGYEGVAMSMRERRWLPSHDKWSGSRLKKRLIEDVRRSPPE